MKKLLFTITLCLLTLSLLSQSCLPEGITFYTQEQIDNFQTDYPECTEIEGDVTVHGNDITNLNGLSVLTSINGKLAIKKTSLTSLTGLENLTSIGGSLGFGDIYFGEQNPFLTSLTGLNSLTTIGGNLNISGAAVTDYTGLDNLISIGGDFGIGGYNTILDLSSLGNLTSIGGNFHISTDTLTSLTGLDNLTSIGGNLVITGSSSLTSLIGLENVSSIGGDLTIILNDSLSICDAISICDYLVSPNGTVEIHDNAPGCNSQLEVEEACNSSISENSTLYGVKTQPNPFSTSTTIEYELKQPEKVTFTIFDYLGKQVYQTKESQQQGKQQLIWNAVKYSDGVYYFNLNAGEQVASGKLMLIR